MAPKMVANFRRSVSFPNHPTCSSSKPKKILHVRSASLPCISHPLISQLKHEINELKSWASKRDARNTAWLCDGLSQLKTVQESLDDLLQLPQTRESLCGHDHGLMEKFLDDFLRFVDVYGTFQTLILTLKERHLAAQMAVRKKDDSKVSLCLKNFRKMAKDFGQLASSLQCMGKLKYSPPSGRAVAIVQLSPIAEEDAEIAQVIKDVIEVTVWVSVALFNGLSASLTSRKPSCLKFSLSAKINTKKVKIEEEGIQEFEEISKESLRKKDEEELRWRSKRMQELEDCIGGIEIGSEKVFRSLINSRVSLLNVLTLM